MEMLYQLSYPSNKFSKRAKGIEPSSQAWKASVLPLNHARKKQHFIISKKPGREKRFLGAGAVKNGPLFGGLLFIITYNWTYWQGLILLKRLA